MIRLGILTLCSTLINIIIIQLPRAVTLVHKLDMAMIDKGSCRSLLWLAFRIDSCGGVQY